MPETKAPRGSIDNLFGPEYDFAGYDKPVRTAVEIALEKEFSPSDANQEDAPLNDEAEDDSF